MSVFNKNLRVLKPLLIYSWVALFALGFGLTACQDDTIGLNFGQEPTLIISHEYTNLSFKVGEAVRLRLTANIPLGLNRLDFAKQINDGNRTLIPNDQLILISGNYPSLYDNAFSLVLDIEVLENADDQVEIEISLEDQSGNIQTESFTYTVIP